MIKYGQQDRVKCYCFQEIYQEQQYYKIILRLTSNTPNTQQQTTNKSTWVNIIINKAMVVKVEEVEDKYT